MKLSNYDYNLPKELIAQYPSEKRGNDRLLVVDRKEKKYEEKKFEDIVSFFKKDDLLVLNNTKVIPARIYGKRKTGGKVEIFIIDKTKVPVEALVRPSGRLDEGERIILESGDEVIMRGWTELGRLVEFLTPVDDVLEKIGHVPLPPYIDRVDEQNDKERYQTVFAEVKGATAAPTAGLHFTKSIITALVNKGIKIEYVTLHVSYGTFAPVKEEDYASHKMHSEYYKISRETISAVKKAKENKSRIIACGTTSVRVLESCADKIINMMHWEDGMGQTDFKGIDGFTNIFIYPGYKFQMVDAMITNFHLPKSTLILLTSAFCGKELLFSAYEYAISRKFKFFSYGDVMLIL